MHQTGLIEVISAPYPILTLLLLGTVVLAIWGHHPDRRWVHHVCKPMATLLLMTIAMVGVSDARIKTWVLTALVFSLIGDIALMFKERYFIPGLVSFCLALLSYALAFTLEARFTNLQWVYALLPISVALVFLNSMWGTFGSLRYAVAGYAMMMALFLWRAFSRFDESSISLSSWALVLGGAMLFMLGDILLARRHFAKIEGAYWIQLGAYFLAQWCLVSGLAL